MTTSGPGEDQPLGGGPSGSWQPQPRSPAAPPPPPPPPPAAPAGGRTPAWAAGLTSTAPVAGPAGFTYADVPNRIVAYIIDAIIVGVLNIIVFAVLLGILGGGILGLVLDLVAGAAVSAGYFVYTWCTQRGTVGMKLLGMQIGHEMDGRTITSQQGLIRWAALVVPFVLMNVVQAGSNEALAGLLGLVGLVWLIVLLVSIAQSPTKQGYHDRVAHTIMVKATRRVA